MPKPSESSTKFIERNRAPRVHIEYELDVNGAQKKVELPFVMGVMSDLSGKQDPEKPLPPVKDRKFLDFDMDNFNDRMKAIKPRAAFSVPNVIQGTEIDPSHEAVVNLGEQAIVKGTHKSRVGDKNIFVSVSGSTNGGFEYTLHDSNISTDISFESMNDFSPEAIAKKVAPLAKLLQDRTELANLLSFMDGRTDAENLMKKLIKNKGDIDSTVNDTAPADS